MKQLTLNQFDLQKVKLTGKRGLKAFWYAMGNNNDLLSVDSDAIVHQDLLDFLEQFRVVFATLTRLWMVGITRFYQRKR